MVVEDVYNMDEIGLFYHAQPNKVAKRKEKLWAQNSEGMFHSCSSCKHNMH